MRRNRNKGIPRADIAHKHGAAQSHGCGRGGAFDQIQVVRGKILPGVLLRQEEQPDFFVPGNEGNQVRDISIQFGR